MSQLALPLAWPAGEGERDLILTPANAHVARHLDHWSLWPVPATLITGPRKSGRSLFGRVFAARLGADLIDDAERRDEEDIFHAWNRAQAEHRPLLIVAAEPPPAWRIRLPDLRSRIAATPQVAIPDPDDALAARLIEKLLAQRGLVPTPDVVAWLLARIERSYVGIHRAIEAIDEAALERRARMSVPLARAALGRIGLIDDSPPLG